MIGENPIWVLSNIHSAKLIKKILTIQLASANIIGADNSVISNL